MILLTSVAMAATGILFPRTSPILSGSIGLGAASQPFRAGLGGDIGIGVFHGKSDQKAMIWKGVRIGAAVEFDGFLNVPPTHISPLLDIRYDQKIVVADLTIGARVGAVNRVGADWGFTGRAVGSVGWSPHPTISIPLTLEGGVNVFPGSPVQPVVGFRAGIEITPWKAPVD